MTQYSYIDNEFARNWIASRHESRRGVFTPLSYIDINEGNRFDADVFAQIMFWHEPNAETNQPRLTRQRDGHLWLVKNHAEWWSETRINKRTIRDCLERLQKRNLIVYEVHGERGLCAPWIRVNWSEFEKRMKLWMEVGVVSLTEKDYQNLWLKRVKITNDTILKADTPLTFPVIPPDISRHTPLTSAVIPLTGNVISNTETTTETTSETTHREKPIAAPPAAADVLSPIGEIDDWLADDLPVQPVTESEPTPVQETPAPEPPKPTELDWTGREMCQLAVRYYFGLQEPKRPSEFSHIQKLVNFFTGKIKVKGKADEWSTHQQSEDPLAAYEIVGLRIWFKGKFEDATLPQKPSTLADYIPQFRLAENYRRCCDTGAKRLLEMRKAMQPAVVEPEPVLSHAAPPAPPVEEDPISPEFDFLPGETLAEYRARLFPRLLANVRGVSA